MPRRLCPLLLLAACGAADRPSTPAVAPAKATAAMDTDTPCFPGRPPLRIAEIFDELHQHRLSIGETRPARPPARFGECVVADGQVRDARGRLVAELPCGIVIKLPGWVDPFGIQVGASGQELLARHAGAGPVSCMPRGSQRASCWFQGQDGIPDLAYIVDAALDADWLDGPAARDFLSARRVVELSYLPDCH